MLKKHTILYCLAMLLLTQTTYAGTLKALKVKTSRSSTQISFEFSTPTAPRYFTLENPNRLVFNFPNTTLASKALLKIKSKKLIRSLRAGMHQKSLRIVVDLKSAVWVDADSYVDDAQKSYIAVLIPLKPKASTHSAKHISTPHTKVQHKIKPAKIKPKTYTVVIDPGHGGHDAGALGQNGEQEKNIALAISKKIKALLNQHKGYRTVLTRSTDRYITLRQRLKIARKYHADLFIAVHADAFYKSSAQGASVYVLSSRGATSEAARWLAHSENRSELMGGEDLDDENALLRSVLLDLQQTATIKASANIGQMILENIGRFAKLHHGKIEQAAFVVLKSPDIPSILLETGFISNWSEARNLMTPSYQKRIARSVVLGILEYFSQ